MVQLILYVGNGCFNLSWVIILAFVLLVAVAIELVYLRKKRKH